MHIYIELGTDARGSQLGQADSVGHLCTKRIMKYQAEANRTKANKALSLGNTTWYLQSLSGSTAEVEVGSGGMRTESAGSGPARGIMVLMLRVSPSWSSAAASGRRKGEATGDGSDSVPTGVEVRDPEEVDGSAGITTCS